MAGTIKNSMLAIIKNEEDVPGYWKVVEDGNANMFAKLEAFDGHTADMLLMPLKYVLQARCGMYVTHSNTQMVS